MTRTGVKKAFVVLGGLMFLVLVLYFLFRDSIFGYALGKVNQQVKSKWGLTLGVRTHGIDGWSTAWMSGVSVTPEKGDTLVQVDTIAFRPDWLALFSGRPAISFLYLKEGRVVLNGSHHGGNLDFINAVRQPAQVDVVPIKSGFSGWCSEVFNMVFSLAPQQSEISNLSFQALTDSFASGISLLHFTSDEKALTGRLEETGTQKCWKIQGAFNQHKRTVSITAFPQQYDKRLPLIKELFGAVAGFDTLDLSITQLKESDGSLDLMGNCAADGFFTYHPKLATDTIRFSSSAFDYTLHIHRAAVELDSSSQLKIGSMTIRPYLSYDRSATSTRLAAHIYIDALAADDFFASLPSGMFDEVRSIRANGNISFSMNFRLDEARPTDVYFHCLMKKDGFRIRDYGTSGLLKLNGEFIHEVFEKDRLVRTFPVGPSNPNYSPLVEVSPYFRNAVLTSEDGNFFFHNGFNEDAFRKSIAENYQAGKFVRGGSTITMQLVKNVFLTRKKTVARKAEEALIVWLIESGRLVSKERLLEVYFNIIELGPGVYGIGEAAQYYFLKKPSQLDLNESIFLASLLPRPKAFRYSFDSLGVLKPYMADYYRVMSNFMLKKNLITPEEYSLIRPVIQLKGPAVEAVIPKDSLAY